MQGIIYKITNIVNNKIYIGQTIMPLRTRWNAHKTRFNYNCKTGLYGAMHKYGIENFNIEEIGKYPREELDNMEKYYIEKYNSFNYGYNLTLGGQGASTTQLNEKEIINKYNEQNSIKDIAKLYNCCELTISNLLHKNNIEIRPSKTLWTTYTAPRSNEGRPKKIKIIELNKVFDSILECGKWLIENDYCNTSNPNLAQRSISRVLNGDRKSYCKLHYEYL